MSDIRKDNILGVNYLLVEYPSAKQLAELLKDTYKDRGIDVEKFNSNNFRPEWSSNKEDKVPNIDEVYEYQNFFLLKEGTDFLLLDGFRRLLWYNAPDIPIQVRVYDRKDLTEEQLLKLIVYLNHFKFYADQKYFDRGFQLFLKTIFDIDITRIHTEFDAYMSSNQTEQSYASWRHDCVASEKNRRVKERIIDKYFIPNMKFLIKAKDRNDIMVNKFFASLLYQKTHELDRTFDPDEFIEEVITSKVHDKLLDSWRKEGNGTGVRASKAINGLQEFYIKAFDKLSGLEVKKTFAEITEDVRQIALKLRKDKSLTKLTAKRNGLHHIEKELLDDYKEGKQHKYKLIIYPKNMDVEGHKDAVPYGLIETCEIIKTTRARNITFYPEEIVIGFWLDKKKTNYFKIWHSYGGYNSYGSKYIHGSPEHRDSFGYTPERKVELFLVNE